MWLQEKAQDEHEGIGVSLQSFVEGVNGTKWPASV
jgi:hypothetical protein